MPTPSPVPLYPHRDLANIYTKWTHLKLLPAYHLALGRFFHQFGQTETTISFHLEEFVCFCLGQDEAKPDVVRALLGSRRTTELLDTTMQVMKAAMKAGSSHTSEHVEELKYLSGQVGEIRYLRDRIAHYAVHPEAIGPEVWFRTINTYTVKDLSRAECLLFKIEHLDAAFEDLKVICARFPRTMFLERRHKVPYMESVRHLYEPWQYKPSELKRRAAR